MAGVTTGWNKMWEDENFHCPISYPAGGFIVDTGTTMHIRTMWISFEARGNLELQLNEITHNSPSNGKCRVKLFRRQGNNTLEIQNGTNLSATIFHIIVLGD